MNRRWIQALLPAALVSMVLTGCGVAAAQTTSGSGSANKSAGTTSNSMANTSNSMGSTSNSMGNTSNSMGNTSNSMGGTGTTGPMKKTTMSAGSPLMIGDVLVGAGASPMMGGGAGDMIFANVHKAMETKLPLSSGANSLQIAITGNTAYVPTLQGETYVVNLATKMVTGHFMTPTGARVATLADGGKLLLVTGKSSVTAYSLPNHMKKWTLNQGGNTLSVAGNSAYLSGPGAKDTVIVNLKTGKQTGTIPVGNIEDSVYNSQMHTLWLANWTNGDMTVVNTMDNKVVKTIQRAEGGGFNPKNMMASKGGFMQVAVGPAGKTVYAASFSGNIMVYNAKGNSFSKDIPVGSMSKLSGIAVDPSGKYVYTTVENKMETVAVSLKTGKVVSTLPKTESNRWYVIH